MLGDGPTGVGRPGFTCFSWTTALPRQPLGRLNSGLSGDATGNTVLPRKKFPTRSGLGGAPCIDVLKGLRQSGCHRGGTRQAMAGAEATERQAESEDRHRRGAAIAAGKPTTGEKLVPGPERFASTSCVSPDANCRVNNLQGVGDHGDAATFRVSAELVRVTGETGMLGNVRTLGSPGAEGQLSHKRPGRLQRSDRDN
jgi:hypothetical protein